jgi:peptidoglycan/xylan/chitin deacetylase (PgdA/CDA1 family)
MPSTLLTPNKLRVTNNPDYIGIPANMLTLQGTIYEDFENSTDWTAGGSGSVSNDTTNFKTGTQGVKLTAASGVVANMVKTVNWDLSGSWERASVSFRLNDDYVKYSNDSIFIKLSNDTTFTNYFRCWIGYNNLQKFPGWITLTFHKDHFSAVNAATWASSIIRVRFECPSVAGNTPSITYDNLKFGVKSIPAVILRFDDGYTSTYTKAHAYMKKYNMRGMVSVDTSAVGTGNHLTIPQLQELDLAGWSMANHTNAATDLTTLSEANQESQILGGKTALLGWGLSKAVNYLVYPSGTYNADTLTAMTNLGVLTGQTTIGPTGTGVPNIGLPFDNPLTLPSNSVTSSTSLATVKGYVDRGIVGGYVECLHFHDIGGSGQMTEANFQLLIDYIYSKWKAGLVYPITIDDFYKLSQGSVRILR